MTVDLVSECQRALPETEALLYAMGGAVVSWLILTGRPWAKQAFREIKEKKRAIEWDPQMLVPGALMVAGIVAPAWVATVIAEPSTIRDAVILGLGAQGFVLAFVGRGK